MESNVAPAAGSSGVQTALNVVFAPKEAFAGIARRPRWLVAFLAATILGIAGQLLISPAVQHMIATTTPAQLERRPQIASLPDERRAQVIAQQVAIAKTIAAFTWVITPIVVLVVAAVQAGVALLVGLATRAQAGFPRLFATTMHVQIVGYGLAALIIGTIVALRGPAAVNSQADIYAVLPSLAWFAPGASRTLNAFLASINVFSVWATVLFVIGLQIAGRFSRGAAIATALVVLLASAGIAAGGAHFSA